MSEAPKEPVTMTVPMTLVTIVAEELLEQRLVRALHEAGIAGYTVTPARGEGARGLREGASGANIRLDTVTTLPVAEALIDYLRERYFANYAIVAWLSDVRVVREEKYLPKRE
jgi:nitrogen regulatory protein P-II 2